MRLGRRATILVLLAVFVLLAGCSGVGGGLEIITNEGSTTAAGDLEITVTVQNTATERKSGDLRCEASVGEQVYETSESIAVDGESRETYDLELEIPRDDYGESSYTCEIHVSSL